MARSFLMLSFIGSFLWFSVALPGTVSAASAVLETGSANQTSAAIPVSPNAERRAMPATRSGTNTVPGGGGRALPGIATQGEKSGGVTSDLTTVSILVKKIDSDAVHAEDGRSFPIRSGTQIIHNHRKDAKPKVAELLFKNQTLTTVILR